MEVGAAGRHGLHRVKHELTPAVAADAATVGPRTVSGVVATEGRHDPGERMPDLAQAVEVVDVASERRHVHHGDAGVRP